MQLTPENDGGASAPPVRIRLLWYPQPQFAGYLLAEHLRLGEVAVRCQPMQPGIGPIEAVLGGQAEFAVASPAHMLESGKADELVMLLAIQQASALVYPARRDAGIAELVDLRGKRIAVWPGREDLELRWMLHHAGIGEHDVIWVPTGDTVSALASGDADCAQMTTYHEVHALEARAGLEEFVIFKPDAEHCLLKDGLVARRDWVAANPAVAQAAVNAALEGWTLAFRQPKEAIRICRAARPDMAEDEQREQLAGIRALALCGATLTRGLGFPDGVYLTRAEAALAEAEGIQAKGLIDSSFWQAASVESRSTAW